MCTLSSGVNFGRVSLLPSACQMRILVYPGSSKLCPVVVNISVPISNFTVVLRYLQSRANCNVRWTLKDSRREALRVRRADARIPDPRVPRPSTRPTYRSDKVPRYVIVQSPWIAVELVSGRVFHRCYRGMIARVVSLLRSVDASCYYLANFLAPFRIVLLLSQCRASVARSIVIKGRVRCRARIDSLWIINRRATYSRSKFSGYEVVSVRG
jgi:hypothetical protein